MPFHILYLTKYSNRLWYCLTIPFSVPCPSLYQQRQDESQFWLQETLTFHLDYQSPLKMQIWLIILKEIIQYRYNPAFLPQLNFYLKWHFSIRLTDDRIAHFDSFLSAFWRNIFQTNLLIQIQRRQTSCVNLYRKYQFIDQNYSRGGVIHIYAIPSPRPNP